MFLVMFYFLYLYLTRTIFDIFNCAPTEPSDGHEYLSVAFVRCGTGFQVKLLFQAEYDIVSLYMVSFFL